MRAGTRSRPGGAAAMLEAPLAACLSGALPPNVALLHLIAGAADEAALERALARAAGAIAEADTAAAERLAGIRRLWQQTPRAWRTVTAMLAAVDHGAPQSPQEWGRLFDRAAGIAPDAAAALYTLGRQDLCERASASILDRLRDWRLLGPGRRVLDLGCGAGRLLPGLAAEADRVAGIDVSAAMLAAARRRCRGLPNIVLRRTAGGDLAGFADGGFDLVLAVDVFPYIVAGGAAMAARLVGEAARVLAPGGSLVILNYSYRGCPERDESELRELAGMAGLAVERIAAGDFDYWDGRTFHLVRGRGAH